MVDWGRKSGIVNSPEVVEKEKKNIATRSTERWASNKEGGREVVISNSPGASLGRRLVHQPCRRVRYCRT